jgi:hypothetical protein
VVLNKKISILLFSLILISQTTFFVRLYQIKRTEYAIENKIENHDFQDKNLLEIKVPLHLPYYSNQSTFHSAKGEVTFEGRIYNYVKARVMNDTLYLLCLPNNLKTELNAELSGNFCTLGLQSKVHLPYQYKVLNILDLDFLVSEGTESYKNTLDSRSLNIPQNQGIPSESLIGVPENPPQFA